MKYLTDKKLKISDFFIFEIKRAKMDKIFKFLKSVLFVISGPMDMIFGKFSETNVRLLKNMIWPFFSKYSKCYNKLNVKSCLKLNGL